MVALADNIVLKVVSMIYDPVTTTDELIPSGETSSYRSNPLKLAEYTLSIKDPAYVGRAKQIQLSEAARIHHESPFSANPELIAVFEKIRNIKGCETVDEMQTGFGSTIYAINPGDGSAREQAASCQKVLGGYANVARKYATKRYRSNLINWGILPFVIKNDPPFILGDYIFIPDIRKAVENEQSEIKSYVISEKSKEFMLCLNALTEDEKKIILLGCLINYYNTI
jgi:aconitate hydratase